MRSPCPADFDVGHLLLSLSSSFPSRAFNSIVADLRFVPVAMAVFLGSWK